MGIGKILYQLLRGEVCRSFIGSEQVGFFTKEAMKKMMKERTKCMELIEMMVVMGKNRIIQLPEEEVNVMGLMEGDELCLSYLVDDRMEGKVNEAREFLVERVR